MSEPWTVKANLEKWMNITIKEIQLEASDAKDGNYSSIIKRLKVIADNGDVYPLIAKKKLDEGPVAEVFGKASIFKKEKEFYDYTLIRIHEIYREGYPDSTDRFAPVCYYCDEEFLLMEDLSVDGFKLKDRYTGLDLDHSLLAIRTLAKFHATSVILLEREPNAFVKFDMGFWEELGTPLKNYFKGLTWTLADEIEQWPKEWERFVPKLRAIGDAFEHLLPQETHRKDDEFNVLSHGDAWTHNMMFKDNAAAVRLLDFQMAHHSSIAIDVHYLLVTSTTLEVKLKHWDYLLQEYHKTFIDTLKALGHQGKLLSFEEFLKEFDKKAVWGLYCLSVNYGVIQSDPSKGYSFDAVLARLETPGPSMYCEMYKDTVKLLLPYFESKGAFSGF